MDDFRRIMDCEDRLAVLEAPMEIGMVPFDPDWPGRWDANFDAAYDDGHGDRISAIEEELFQRFRYALKQIMSGFSEQIELAPDCEDLEASHGPARAAVGLLLVQRYPGLNVSSAMTAFCRQHSYAHANSETKRKWDYLEWALDIGYRPPASPDRLVRTGTVGAEGPCDMPNPIAKCVAGKALAGSLTSDAIEQKLAYSSASIEAKRNDDDAQLLRSGRKDLRVNQGSLKQVTASIRKRPRYPWPRGMFFELREGIQPGLGLPALSPFVALKRLSDSAFKRAYREVVILESIQIRRTDEGQWLMA